MTTIDEEYRSLGYARQFLLSLLDPKQTPRVPKGIRQEAGHWLKHYPPQSRINELYGIRPTIKSVCCGADVIVSGITTHHYMCLQCHRPCDVTTTEGAE